MHYIDYSSLDASAHVLQNASLIDVKAIAVSRISADELWEIICGKDSLIALFADTPGLCEIVRDVYFETLESEKFFALATLDTYNDDLPLIQLSTGCYDAISGRVQHACEIARNLGIAPWKALGWRKSPFGDDCEFAALLTRIILDFLVLHELGHVARGHVDRYTASQPLGMAETSASEPPELSEVRRQALELDADSCAIYHLVTLAPLFLAHYSLYRPIPNIGILMAILGLGIRIMFMLLSEYDMARNAKAAPPGKQSLADRHRGLTHPLPSVRGEFADQRIQQLATDQQERRSFRRAHARSWGFFLGLVGHGLFPSMSSTLWEYEAGNMAAYLNLLIDEIAAAQGEGWMQQNSRSERALNIIEALRAANTVK